MFSVIVTFITIVIKTNIQVASQAHLTVMLYDYRYEDLTIIQVHYFFVEQKCVCMLCVLYDAVVQKKLIYVCIYIYIYDSLSMARSSGPRNAIGRVPSLVCWCLRGILEHFGEYIHSTSSHCPDRDVARNMLFYQQIWIFNEINVLTKSIKHRW